MANRESYKSVENVCAPYYMATPEEKQVMTSIDTYSKTDWQMYFSDNLRGVNPVVMNYKMRHNKNDKAKRHSLAWPDCFFFYYLCMVAENGKTRSGHVRLWANIAMEECLHSVWVRQSIGQSMNIATFSTPDLWERCHKSYVASYRANEELAILQMFSRELCQWRWFVSVDDSQYRVNACSNLLL